MNMNKAGVVIATAFFLLLGEGAFALGQQEPTIGDFPDTELGFAYIPQQDFEVSGSIDIAHFSTQEADYFIVVDYGQNAGSCGGGSFARCVANPNDPNDTVRYELRNEGGNVIRDLADAGDSSQVISGTAPAGSGVLNYAAFSAVLSIFIEAGQLQDSNPAYEDTLSMRFYYGNIEDSSSYDPANPDATATLTVLGNVPPFVEVALVEEGEGYPRFGRTTQRTMDFGVMSPGDSQQYDLLVQTNALLAIDLASTNGGVMAYQGTSAPPGLPTEVDYELSVDGQIVDLSGGTASLGTGLSGFRWPFVVTILPYDVPVAGNYQDVIDITVSAVQ